MFRVQIPLKTGIYTYTFEIENDKMLGIFV
jgi:hypothetical protein